MARKSSLGPFPKSHRWTEIVGSPILADQIIGLVRARLEALKNDEQALRAILFFVALPVASRYPSPERAMDELFGLPPGGALKYSLDVFVGRETPASRAALATLNRFTSSPRFQQSAIVDDPWLVWRGLDGSPFCELARVFFACLAEQLLLEHARYSPELVAQHAWELSKITQSFSARWFNKCAVNAVPERRNVRWYLGHCLGKLDIEFERELSTHVEPLPNPFRRRRVEPPSLGLGI